jgi:hypothetical protein
MTSMDRKRLTTIEAAFILGISDTLVRRYCRTGRLGQRIGRDYSITMAQLKAFSAIPRPRGPRPKKSRQVANS